MRAEVTVPITAILPQRVSFFVWECRNSCIVPMIPKEPEARRPTNLRMRSVVAIVPVRLHRPCHGIFSVEDANATYAKPRSRAKGKFLLAPLPPLSLSQKAENPHSAWPTQVADHLVPNQVLGFFEFFRERERGKFSVFKGLQKPLSAQIQGN